MELAGERIYLREFAASDVGALFTIHSDPHALRYYPPELGTPEHAQMLVEMFIRWAAENPRLNFQLAIVDRTTKVLLGSCGIRREGCLAGQGEFGIGIGRDWWGKGIAQEAAKIVLAFAFAELELDEIRAVAVVENEAVTKFLQRLGFSPGMRRRGDAWMVKKGLSAIDWRMTRDAWEDLTARQRDQLRQP
jgi:RimJ/RimL family protein N-acetyltransferase